MLPVKCAACLKNVIKRQYLIHINEFIAIKNSSLLGWQVDLKHPLCVFGKGRFHCFVVLFCFLM